MGTAASTLQWAENRGKSWFFYPIERLGGIEGYRDTSRGWMQRHDLRPGRILWEVQEAYQPGVVKDRLTRGPLEFSITSTKHRFVSRKVGLAPNRLDNTSEAHENVLQISYPLGR
jgi:hypothetical protein